MDRKSKKIKANAGGKKSPLPVDLSKAAATALVEMEALALKIRQLVLSQPPIQLLGYFIANFHMAMMLPPGTSEDARPNKDAIRSFQFSLEYLHAVWSGATEPCAESIAFDESRAAELMNLFEELQTRTMLYCLGSSKTKTEFQAKSTWTLIRGHRYQVLEEEFFRYILEPHDAALRAAYGVGSVEIAEGIQNISNSFRTGLAEAANKLISNMQETQRKIQETGEDLQAAIESIRAQDGSFEIEMSDIYSDIFLGGVCNLSRHSKLPSLFLEDLSYEPGENTEFFADGRFCGTPMRTLPARIKPGIKLDDQFYATDGQFVRDSAYRAIQWGLWKRLPYRDEWLKLQGRRVEEAYPRIFSKQLRGAVIHESVFYKDPDTGRWAETDLLIILEDALFVIEAKAGVMPMQSPATNFASHERVIQDLIVKAFHQCDRFIRYLFSEPEVSLYRLLDGQYVEIGRIRGSNFRIVLPIGLTVEAFTPFSAMAKELPEISLILDKFAFISMSVDDLFVLTRFLRTAGELLHYLEVRQQVAGIEAVLIFDEMDHLGAYIARNRFDVDIREQLKEADQVTWDSFSDEVDRYFERENWQRGAPPSQKIPYSLDLILGALDKFRPMRWLRFDSLLRDCGQRSRDSLAAYIDQLHPTLRDHPRRRFFISGELQPLQIWLCRQNEEPPPADILFQAQASCLAMEAKGIDVLVVSYRTSGEIGAVGCYSFGAPSVLLKNYPELMMEAERQRIKIDRIR